MPGTTCSFTELNSLLKGCTDAVIEEYTNPGGIALGGIAATAAGSVAKDNPLAAAGAALGIDTLGNCAYGAINTAFENCDSTSKTTGSDSSGIKPIKLDIPPVEPPFEFIQHPKLDIAPSLSTSGETNDHHDLLH